jgi:hypothetical protein
MTSSLDYSDFKEDYSDFLIFERSLIREIVRNQCKSQISGIFQKSHEELSFTRSLQKGVLHLYGLISF